MSIKLSYLNIFSADQYAFASSDLILRSPSKKQDSSDLSKFSNNNISSESSLDMSTENILVTTDVEPG